LFNATSDETLFVPAFSVTAIDTTGAGDCFAGYAVASLAAGLAPAQALRRASAAAALQVQHPGASAAIPTAAEVDDFLAAQD
jgi:ribokinase